MSGKRETYTHRPKFVSEEEFIDNWARTFNRGVAERSKASSSNLDNIVGSNPTSAAIYVNDATGEEVTENWWPDPL